MVRSGKEPRSGKGVANPKDEPDNSPSSVEPVVLTPPPQLQMSPDGSIPGAQGVKVLLDTSELLFPNFRTLACVLYHLDPAKFQTTNELRAHVGLVQPLISQLYDILISFGMFSPALFLIPGMEPASPPVPLRLDVDNPDIGHVGSDMAQGS